jgi:hypothetical protein
MAGHVFKEDEPWANLIDDTPDVGPQVAVICGAAPTPGLGKRLAGVARSDDIHHATPWLSVEGGKIVPYRRAIQGFVDHPLHERRRRVSFPFDVTNSSISVEGDVEAEIKASDAGAEGETAQIALDGT